MRAMPGSGARHVLVTGASYGLGAAVASRVRADNGLVYSVSRSRPCDEDADLWVKADLGDVADLPRVADALRELLGDQALDGVVFNAALADKSATQWTVAQVERHFRLNALSPVALWAALEERGMVDAPCNVVLLGSFLQNGSERQPAYAMSKAALWSWMRSYTLRQAADHPVSMNMIWPSRVLTPGNPRRPLPADDPNVFHPPERVAESVYSYLTLPTYGPRGTTVDLGRS